MATQPNLGTSTAHFNPLRKCTALGRGLICYRVGRVERSFNPKGRVGTSLRALGFELVHRVGRLRAYGILANVPFPVCATTLRLAIARSRFASAAHTDGGKQQPISGTRLNIPTDSMNPADSQTARPRHLGALASSGFRMTPRSEAKKGHCQRETQLKILH
jgi:hypothetical protein